jgi:hypothetical protein
MNKELYSAIVKAQAAMSHAAKDSKNPHFKSAYSSLASVIDAVRPALSANNLAFVQKLHTADNGISIETVLIHESGQEMSCGILFIPATKQDAQGFGSAISYGKRYSLQSALGIASEDDDGQSAVKTVSAPVKVALDLEIFDAEMMACKTEAQLQAVAKRYWPSADAGERAHIKAIGASMKEELENNRV